jgi:hypothetical protein
MKKFYRLLCILLLLLLAACETSIDFKKTKEGQGPFFNSVVENVKAYKVIFNPKGNGIIAFTLASGSEYQAEKLNASQISSVLTLLRSKDIQFNTESKELILNANTNE